MGYFVSSFLAHVAEIEGVQQPRDELDEHAKRRIPNAAVHEHSPGRYGETPLNFGEKAGFLRRLSDGSTDAS